MAKIDKSTKVISLDVSQAVDGLTKLQQKVVELAAAYNQLDGRTKEGIAAKERLTSASDKLTASLKRETAAVNQDTTAHSNSTQAIQLQINKLREEMQVMDMSTDAYKSKASEMRILNESMHEGARATGLASTSAMEFGRVVSDAPYGIRGMANNVSQLTSLLFMGGTAIDATTGKMIGLSGAIKNMWKAMMGPLGIMIAIQAIIAAIDYFAGSTEKAADEVSNMADQIYDLEAAISDVNTTMDAYIEILNGSEKGSRGYINTLKELKKLGIDPTTMSQEEFNKAMETSRQEQEELLILKNKLTVEDQAVNDKSIIKLGIEQEFGDQRVKILKLKAELQDKVNDGLSTASGRYANYAATIQEAEAQQIKNNERLLQISTELTQAKKESTTTQVRILKLEPPKEEKGRTRKTRKKKDFTLKETDLEEDTIKQLAIQEDLLAKSNLKKLEINQEYEAIDLFNKHDDWKIAAKLKFDTYMESKASPKQKLAAEKLYMEELTYAESEYLEASTQMTEAQTLTTQKFKKDAKIAFDAEMFDLEIARMDNELTFLENVTTDNDMAAFERLQEQEALKREREIENFELTREARRAELILLYKDEEEVETLMAQERAAFQASIADQELQAIKDKIDKKKQIQEEYLGWLSGTSVVLKNIGKRNEAIAIAGLALEKGAAIAGIVVKASASNAKAVAAAEFFAAETQAANAGLPFGAGAPISAALIATNAASTKAGILKTNIGAGISIAKIASTLITAKGGSPASPSSSGGAASTAFTPNFNVVGNSNENQLAEGISNQVNTPTRAYVVYDDISEAGAINDSSIESSSI